MEAEGEIEAGRGWSEMVGMLVSRRHGTEAVRAWLCHDWDKV